MSVLKRLWNQAMFASNEVCLLCDQSISPYLAINSMTNPYHHAVKLQLCVRCFHSVSWITTIQCARCGRASVCADCQYHQLENYMGNRSAVQYTTKMKEWLQKYKFQGHQKLYQLFGNMMLPVYESVTWKAICDQQLQLSWRKSKYSIIQFAQKNQLWDAIVPVPISQQRLMERGFNQAAFLAKHLSQYYQLPYYELLQRSKDGEKLSNQGKWQRAESVQNRFTINRVVCHEFMKGLEKNRFDKNVKNCVINSSKSSVEQVGVRILLVDDVYTTGNTIMACSEALLGFSMFQSLQCYSLTWARA